MWGWALATARLGIRHTVVPELQAEPGGDGIRDLSRFFIYHYTFDLGQAGGSWRWSKRISWAVTRPKSTSRRALRLH